MTQIKIKRVYLPPEPTDGFRVLVDKLWPRGIRKENLPYDLWAKDVTPSTPLRQWFHVDPDTRWTDFKKRYLQELETSPAAWEFAEQLEGEKTVTLLYASKNPTQNHALALQQFLEKTLKG